MIKKIIYKIFGIPLDAISFQSGIDLTGNPIVTFHQGDKKLNFILDTGSNICIIDSTVLKGLEYKKLDVQSDNAGVEGDVQKFDTCSIKIYLKDKGFECPCVIRDMSRVFKYIKKCSGVTVHGLLGTNFLTEFKYVLDFKELIAYSKK